ncbi:glycosyltransferase family protein [Pedobacter montanisoli]|uniref:Glycosyltransferase subfamily 4-like N-terminal domain-containing protein n=1 Tax=Pedobacter montanisoli TaxID=2923277 RepID=A0ABS9ZTP2_9SPHI|nr:hypothetical protein [Pedobacter montanisoli]MCJ0741732.1 hypothetical protein [Pedobacter montanisoli]
MKRIFVFSYHGKETYHTGYYRLLSLANTLAENFEVYFIHGNINEVKKGENKENLIEIPLLYRNGILQKVYAFLKKKSPYSAKLLVIINYLFTKREIFDLQKETLFYFNKSEIKPAKDDIIFTSFPSLSAHNLGYELKKKYHSKLVLEYRDPGVFGYNLIYENEWMSRVRKSFLKKQEIRNLESADLLLTISDSIKKFFPERYYNNVHVVGNGFNNHKIDISLIRDNKQKFILSYLGSIYSSQLEDLTFFEAVKDFTVKYKVSPDRFLLKFIGINDVPVLNKIITRFGLENYTSILAKMPIEKAYDELYDSSMFFHLKYGNRKEVITTKQYEYLAFQKPILLPVSDDGDIAESIKKYNAGYICNHKKEIIEVLHISFKNHLEGKPLKINHTAEELYELSRQSQEEKLVNLMNEL